MAYITARILAIECIRTLAIASTLFVEVAYRAACDFVLETRAELLALAFEVVVFGFAALEALFVELFATVVFFVLAVLVPAVVLLVLVLVAGASFTGAATFNCVPARKVFEVR